MAGRLSATLPRLLKRFLVPRIVTRGWFLVRHRTVVSGRAEVDFSRSTRWGRGGMIGSFVKLKIDGPLVVGRDVHVGAGCFISVGPAGITIGDDVMIAPNSSIIATNYNYDRLDVVIRDQGTRSQGIVIGSNVWIGANVAVLDGARIGDGAVITAGSVVSGEIPANAIVRGNPGRVVMIRRQRSGTPDWSAAASTSSAEAERPLPRSAEPSAATAPRHTPVGGSAPRRAPALPLGESQ